MIDLTGQVKGAEAVVARLNEAGVNFSQRVPKTVHALGLEVLKVAKEWYLTGGSLNVRSGRLRRSVNEKFTEPAQWTYKSSVGTSLPYGRFWELGFHGFEEVKAHLRRTRGQVKADKAAKKAAKGQRDFWTGKQKEVRNSKGMIQVKAHQRKVDQNPRPFLVPSLEVMKDEIRTRLLHAVSGRTA